MLCSDASTLTGLSPRDQHGTNGPLQSWSLLYLKLPIHITAVCLQTFSIYISECRKRSSRKKKIRIKEKLGKQMQLMIQSSALSLRDRLFLSLYDSGMCYANSPKEIQLFGPDFMTNVGVLIWDNKNWTVPHGKIWMKKWRGEGSVLSCVDNMSLSITAVKVSLGKQQ